LAVKEDKKEKIGEEKVSKTFTQTSKPSVEWEENTSKSGKSGSTGHWNSRDAQEAGTGIAEKEKKLVTHLEGKKEK